MQDHRLTVHPRRKVNGERLTKSRRDSEFRSGTANTQVIAKRSVSCEMYVEDFDRPWPGLCRNNQGRSAVAEKHRQRRRLRRKIEVALLHLSQSDADAARRAGHTHGARP